MQGMTRNPLASPSLMGITDGAVFGIAIMYAFFPNSPYSMFVIASFIEPRLVQALYMELVFFTRWINTCEISFSRCTISALLGAISSGIALYFNLAQEVSMWNAGGVAGVKWQSINMLVPIGLVCLLSQL